MSPEVTNPPTPRSHLYGNLMVVLTVIYGIIIFTTYTEYGITNEEVGHAKYGQDIVRWYTSLFQDTEVFNSANTWLYGGFYDTITHLIFTLPSIALGAALGILAIVRKLKIPPAANDVLLRSLGTTGSKSRRSYHAPPQPGGLL